ncbi:prolyl 3-hydroxylase OGFOD1-like isoform X2 [Watersipora subatra]
MRSALGMVKDWLSQLLDVQLSDKIDLFSAQYKYTDTLLCHDDELEGRRVAFIYYLVPENWEAADGGALDLFSTDAETGLPESIVKSIVPSRNSFLFFEVTHKSFHQVAEVLSKSKCRLSLSGWFRGPPAIRPEKVCSAEVISKQQAVDIEEEVFYKYISAEYINPATLSEIQETFEVESEIQLQDFFNTSVYERICKDITSDDITWKRIGPAVKRNIEVAELDTLPSSLKECLQFLISDAVLLTLSNITGLKLHHLAPDSEDEDEPESKKSKTSANGSGGGEEMKTGTVSYQVRRWSHGSYTLLHDTQMEQQTECTLEAFVHLNCDSWDEKQGGYTSYVAKGEDEELITVEPRRNCLSLVYKDAEAMGFVKHINHRISETDPPCFYDIALMYHEIEN